MYIYEIMKTMCLSGYNQNGFLATRILGLRMYSYIYIVFEWFWMESLRKSAPLIVVILKDPFLVVLLSYFILTISLMMLSIILISG